MFPCEFCEKSFGKRCLLIAHERVHTGEKPFSCKACGKRFSWKGDLGRHMRTHTGEKPYCCDFCQKKFKAKSELTMHIRKHTGERPFICEVCGKAFGQRSILEFHSKTHQEERNFVCEICSASFKWKGNLEKHVKTHLKQYPCGQCELVFTLYTDLMRHKKYHTKYKKKRRYPCDICEEAFPSPRGLAGHLRTHADYKPHVCEECGKGFRLKSNCIRHQRTHIKDSSELTFLVCEECGKKLSCKASLERHLKTHSSEKPFSCTDCGKRFTIRENLQSHLRTHAKEKQNVENEKSILRDTLVFHLNNVTSDMNVSRVDNREDSCEGSSDESQVETGENHLRNVPIKVEKSGGNVESAYYLEDPPFEAKNETDKINHTGDGTQIKNEITNKGNTLADKTDTSFDACSKDPSVIVQSFVDPEDEYLVNPPVQVKIETEDNCSDNGTPASENNSSFVSPRIKVETDECDEMVTVSDGLFYN